MLRTMPAATELDLSERIEMYRLKLHLMPPVGILEVKTDGYGGNGY